MWGLGFADGRKVTNVDPPPEGHPRGWSGDECDWVPDHPILLITGGSSTGSRAVDVACWLWPLPPPALCTWSANGPTKASPKRCTT